MPKYITLTRVTQTELPPRPTFNEESLFLSNDGKLKTLSGASGQVEDVIEGGSSEVTAASITDSTAAGRSMLTAEDAEAQAGLLAPYISGGLDSSAVILAQAGDDLLAKYTAAKALTPNGSAKSATNRAALVIMPGTYALSATLTCDANFVDVIGLGATEKKPAVLLTGNSISIPNTVTDAKFSGISVGVQAFEVTGIAPAANDLRVFTNCIGGGFSFGYGGTASGTFTNCNGGNYSFGGNGTATGTFENCVGGGFSFGYGGTASGTFTNCIGGIYSFSGGGGTASGTFTDCTGGAYSFGGTASGTFTNCIGGIYSFSGGGGTASGTFTNCIGAEYSFGSNNPKGSPGHPTGTFTDCVGGNLSFGTDFTGKLYRCRLTSGEFPTIVTGGITRLCIDGNNVENNQG